MEIYMPHASCLLSCILLEISESISEIYHLSKYYVLYVGESGVVYKGYIDTPLGSELVAVKTGKGKEKFSFGLYEHKVWVYVYTL